MCCTTFIVAASSVHVDACQKGLLFAGPASLLHCYHVGHDPKEVEDRVLRGINDCDECIVGI